MIHLNIYTSLIISIITQFITSIIEIIALVKKIHPYKNVAIRHFGNSIYDTNILFSDHQEFI